MVWFDALSHYVYSPLTPQVGHDGRGLLLRHPRLFGMTPWDVLAVTLYGLFVAFVIGYVTAKALEALS